MTSTNPAEVDLVITFRASTQANAKSEAKDAETQYILLLDILQKAGFKAVGRRGKELGHLLVLVKCPEDLLKHLLKNERTSDFLSGLPSKLDAPLTPSDRIRLIQTYITSSTEQGGLGIIPSSSGQWSRVESVMALHDPDYNERWIHAWTHSKSPSGYENSLRDMFGESVALYFTFLQSYTYALIAPSILGASFYFLDLSYSPIYSSLLLLWAIAYVEWWRIYERLVALRFGSLGHFRVEKKRPSNSRVQWWHRELRIAAGIPVILVFAGLLSVLLSAIFVFEAFLTQLYTGPLHEYVGLTPTVLFMLVVPSFMSVYEAFAQRFTAWESHAHESTHMRSLTLKTFAVSSLVKYLGLALSAFVYVPFGEVASEWIVMNVPNVPADTKLTLNPARLKDQMFAFTVTQQAVGTFLEIGMPFLMRKFRGVSEKKNNGNGKRKVQFEDEKPRGGEEEQKFLERVREEAALPEYDVFSDYTEMLNQFGYVVLWSTIWPLAPAMALINNFFEIRSDAFKITVHTRRPMPVRTDTIGPWLNVLDILTWVGAMTNAVLVYLFCPRGQDQCSSSPVEKVQMHLRAHDPVHRNATLTESLLETDAGREGVSAPWELFMKVMVIALVASHVHMVVRKLMRHGLEKVFWGSSLEVKEKEARQRGYLKKVFEESEVKGIAERGDVNVTKPEDKEFWTYDEGVEEIHRLSKEA